MVFKTNEIIFALNLITLYLIIYYSLKLGVIQENLIFLLEFSLGALGIVCYYLLIVRSFAVHSLLRLLFKISSLIVATILMAPFYRTMNSSYADDSIYAMVFGSIILHLISKNYDVSNPNSK